MCNIGGNNLTIDYGQSGGFIGLDQVNVKLPRSLAGRGDQTVALTIDAKTTRPVTVNFK